MAPYSRKLLKGISYIYTEFLNITQSLNVIGVLGRLNNLCQPLPLGHTQKSFKNISILQEKYYYNAIDFFFKTDARPIEKLIIHTFGRSMVLLCTFDKFVNEGRCCSTHLGGHREIVSSRKNYF
jgi:hypothetical protein